MGIERKIVRMCRREGVPIVTRRQWKSGHRALYQWRRLHKPHALLGRGLPADTLVQHITVTIDDGTLRGDFFNDMLEVERIGYERFKSGFSYNFGWDMKTGMIGLGMPITAKGTHTVNDKGVSGYSYDQNYVALAIGAIGMPGDIPTQEALDILAKFISILIRCGALTMEHDYDPHSKFAYKDCPTDALRNAMPYVNRKARRLVRIARRCKNL